NQSLQHEIIDRQEAECKNRNLAAQLTHAARLSTIGHFTAALAHEINQPLATIANDAGTCAVELENSTGPEIEKLRQQVEHIKQAALRAGNIVRRIRNFVRPNSPSLPMEIDLNAVVEEVVELCRLEAQRDTVQISIQLASEAAIVSVDQIQIQQVL